MSDQFTRTVELQDLGDASVKVRKTDEVGPTGVEIMLPDDGDGHLDALGDIREVIDEHYGERLEDIAGVSGEIVIERVVFRSDALPHIEYRVVEEQ